MKSYDYTSHDHLPKRKIVLDFWLFCFVISVGEVNPFHLPQLMNGQS